MIVNFTTYRTGKYGLTILGLENSITTDYPNQYIPEEDPTRISIRNYLFTHTVALNILKTIRYDNSVTIEGLSISNHKNDPTDSQEYLLTKDGLYEISRMIIPTNEWLDLVLSIEPTNLDEYSDIYYYNIADNNFYKYADGVSTIVPAVDLLDAYASEKTPSNNNQSTIIKGEKRTFVMYFLNECFGKLSKELLLSLPNNCNINSDTYRQKIFNRDVLWMGINSVKYLIESQPPQLFEAQRLLEELNRCNDLCDTSNITLNYGCGCSK